MFARFIKGFVRASPSEAKISPFCSHPRVPGMFRFLRFAIAFLGMCLSCITWVS